MTTFVVASTKKSCCTTFAFSVPIVVAEPEPFVIVIVAVENHIGFRSVQIFPERLIRGVAMMLCK